MLYYLTIAGISICCDIPFSIRITEESEPFISCVRPDNVDVTCRVIPVDSLPLPPVDAVYESGNYYLMSGDSLHVYYADRADSQAYTCVFADFHTGQILCQYVSGTEKRFSLSRGILNFLNIETILLRSCALMLHCAFIRVSGSGILFSAPSGTGKSTQADLWQKFRGADIINGDRAALRRCDHIWTAWGLPYAGTSGIYRNESAPVSAIVVLRQFKMNTIRRLRPSEALRYLYPELTLHRWESDSVEKAIDLLTDLVTSVPVFLLECRPDEEAVRTLESALKEVSQ